MLLRCLLLIFALTMPLVAQQGREQSLIGNLHSAPDRASFDAALTAARKAEISPQMLSEAKLLFGLRMQDNAYLASLLPELDAATLDFAAIHSLMGVRTVEQWRGLVSYVRALRAQEAKDEDAFREAINDAFWNYPQQASLFGGSVARFQLQQKMQRWTVDFAQPLTEVGGHATTVGDMLGSHAGMLMVFWDDEDRARATLTRVNEMAKHIQGSGIVTLGIHLRGAKGEALAEKIRKDLSITWPWTFENEDRGLSTMLEVQESPRAVLITRQGKVIFHGHPVEPSLFQAMKRLVPLMRPMPIAKKK